MTDSDQAPSRPSGANGDGDVDGSDPSFPIRGPWERASLDRFLDDAVVPIRIACRTPSGGLWMVSLWFRYRDGRLWCATAADADLVTFLRDDPDVAFEISVNDPPYKGVRGQGTVAIDDDSDKETLRALIKRYLGDTDSPLAQSLLAEDREEVTLRIDVTNVATWDYSERMADEAG